MIINGINIDPLIRSYKKFKQFHTRVTNPQPSDDRELNEAGLIQGFEFCYERCWKTMRKLLNKEGLQPKSMREIFRMASDIGFIADPELWFLFQDKRNISAHVYDEHEISEILSAIEAFDKEAVQFIQHLAGPNALD